MKALKITLTILLAIGGIFAAYYFYAKSKANPTNETEPGADPTASSPTGIQADNDKMPLKKGSIGPLVTDLQRGINKNFGGNISIDGIFGPQTESALRGRGLPIIIYWREWSYITKKPILVNGVLLTIAKL